MKGEVGMWLILADSADSVPRIASAVDDYETLDALG